MLAEQFQSQGYAVAQGFLSPQEVDEIRTTFMTQAKDGPVEGLSEIRHGGEKAYDPSDPLALYPRMMHPHNHMDKPVGPVARRYLLDPRLHPLLRSFMNDEPVAVQTMFYFKPPGARGQDLHQDNYYLRVKPGNCCAAWFAIDDADEGNGGMVVVPGTQDMEIACPEPADSEKYFTTEHVEPPPGMSPVPVNLRAGDVLFFNGSLVHGSFPNTSAKRFRRSLICHYVPESAVELAHWYTTRLRFDGSTRHSFTVASGGGPCGSLQSAPAAH